MVEPEDIDRFIHFDESYSNPLDSYGTLRDELAQQTVFRRIRSIVILPWQRKPYTISSQQIIRLGGLSWQATVHTIWLHLIPCASNGWPPKNGSC